MCNQDSPDTLFEALRGQDTERDEPFAGLCLSAASLKELLWMAYRASLQPEEGRSPTMVIFVSPTKDTQDYGVWFEQPIPLSGGALRRLAAGVPHRPQSLVVQELEPGKPCAVGLSRSERMGQFHLSPSEVGAAFHINGLYLEVRGPGHLVVTNRSSLTYVTLELKACKVRELWDVSSWGAGRRVIDRFVSYFREKTVAPVSVPDATAVGRLLLTRALSRAVDLAHGGAFVVAPFDDVRECLGDFFRCRDYGSRQRESWQWVLTDRELSADGHVVRNHVLTEERLLDLPACLGQLSAIDGAVVLGPCLSIQAFGAEITSGSDGVPDCVLYDHRDQPGEDFPILQRGTRNRSAARLCSHVDNATVFLVSQDKDLVVYSSGEGHVRVYTSLGLIAGASATS